MCPVHIPNIPWILSGFWKQIIFTSSYPPILSPTIEQETLDRVAEAPKYNEFCPKNTANVYTRNYQCWLFTKKPFFFANLIFINTALDSTWFRKKKGKRRPVMFLVQASWLTRMFQHHNWGMILVFFCRCKFPQHMEYRLLHLLCWK